MEADAMKKKRHIEKIHLAREEKFTCNKCDAKCNSRQYLREHKHKEHGRPSQCAICYKEVIGERKFIIARKTVQELQSKSMQTSLAAKMREKNCW